MDIIDGPDGRLKTVKSKRTAKRIVAMAKILKPKKKGGKRG